MLPPWAMLATKNWNSIWVSFTLALLAVVFLNGCAPSGPRALLDGDRLISEGKYSDAIEKLKVAVNLLPNHPQAWNRLGLAYHGGGRTAEAVQSYQRALKLDPNLAPVRYNLGCLLLENNQLQGAIAELTAFTVLTRTSAEGWLKLGTAQLRARQLDAAGNSFRFALQQNASLPEALNGLGMIQLQRNRIKDATNYFNAALHKQRNYGPALLNLAVLNHSFNNKPLALQIYRDYLKTRPPQTQASAVEEAIRRIETELNPSLRRTAATNEATPAPSRLLANPVTNFPPTAQAIAATNPLATAAPPLPSLPETNLPKRVSLGPAVIPEPRTNPVHVAATDPPKDQQAKVSPPSIAQQNTTTNTPVNLPAAQTQTNQPISQPRVVSVTEEPPILTAEEKKSPPQPAPVTNSVPAAQTQTNQVASVEKQKSTETVPDLSRKISPRDEKPGLVDRINPLSWFRDKKQTEVTANRQEPIRKSIPPTTAANVPAAPQPTPNNLVNNSSSATPLPVPTFKRYDYKSTGRPAGGNRQKANAVFVQGLKAHQNGQLVEARGAYREALKLDPSHFEANYNLGLIAYQLKDAAESLSSYENALSINPTSTDARYNFALSLERANYPLDAIVELERVLSQQPNESRAHFTLAKLYAERLFQPEIARQHYQKVLDLEPNHPQATAIRFWLASRP